MESLAAPGRLHIVDTGSFTWEDGAEEDARRSSQPGGAEAARPLISVRNRRSGPPARASTGATDRAERGRDAGTKPAEQGNRPEGRAAIALQQPINEIVFGARVKG